MTDWQPIPGFDGLYEVSADGAVRSIARTVNLGYAYRGLKKIPLTELAPFIRHGVGFVALPCDDWRTQGGPRWKTQRKFPVPRLTHMAWVGPIPEGWVVREVAGLGPRLADRLIAIPRALNLRLNSREETARENARKELDRRISERAALCKSGQERG